MKTKTAIANAVLKQAAIQKQSSSNIGSLRKV